jgi:ubiquitin C-terminal hydrolase
MDDDFDVYIPPKQGKAPTARVMGTRTRHRTENPKFSMTAEQYCGIRNLGATCYMNSILQALYHLPAFRKIIFQMPSLDSTSPTESIVFNLQRLFGLMQTGTEPVSTEMLTRSFGWDDLALESQQDIQEFMRLVIENLEKKLKGTAQENAIADLFKGSYRSFVRCVAVDFESTREEAFYDLSLVVKGCSCLQESILKFLEIERLEGVNQYKTENFGPQDAIMGSEFVQLPVVLHLHLRRFEYDQRKGRMAKIMSKYEFPETIDMGPFLPAKKADVNMVYDLFGVLVHAGDGREGHFYAFLRTSPSEAWFEFNDSNVSVSNLDAAVYRNFGGGRDSKSGHFSAYMLIYMRHSELSNLFCEIPHSLIPPITLDFPTEECEDEDIFSLSVYTENMIVPKFLWFGSNAILVAMKQTDTMADLYRRVGKAVDCKQLRLWYCTKSSLNSVLECDQQLSVDTALLSTQIFAEFVYRPMSPLSLLIFCMFYSPVATPDQPMHFISSFSVENSEEISTISSRIRELLRIPPATTLSIFSAVSGTEMYEVNEAQSFHEVGISNGSYLIFQFPAQSSDCGLEFPAITKVETDLPLCYFDVFPEELPITADVYFRLMRDCVSATLLGPLFEETRIVFPQSFDWSHFHLFGSRAVEVPFDREEELMLVYIGRNTVPVNEIEHRTVRHIILLDSTVSLMIIPKTRFDQRLRVVIEISYDGIRVSNTIVKLFSEGSTAGDLISVVRETEGFGRDQPMRILTRKGNQLVGFVDDMDAIATLRNPLRVEAVPMDQLTLSEGSFLVRVEFRERGTPFLFRVVQSEVMQETMKRMQNFMTLSTAEFVKLQICWISDTGLYMDIPMESTLSDHVKAGTRLGILSAGTNREGRIDLTRGGIRLLH